MVKKYTKTKKSKTLRNTPKKKHTALQATIFAAITIVLVLILLVVELRPVRSFPSWGGTGESFALATISAKVFAAMNGSGRSADEYCTMIFSPDEVNAMLAMILRVYANEKKPGDPPLYAKWNKGGWSDTECSIKFAGIYFNFYLQTAPSISKGKLFIAVSKCRLGKLPLPADAVEKALNNRLQQEINKDYRLQKSLSLIHSLQAEKNGELRIEVPRKNSGKLLKSIF